MKEKGPYGQFLRLRRNCALETDYKKHSAKMTEDYINRGYPAKIIEPQRTRADIIDRKSLFTPKMPKLKSERIPLVLTFNPMNSILKRW